MIVEQEVIDNAVEQTTINDERQDQRGGSHPRRGRHTGRAGKLRDAGSARRVRSSGRSTPRGGLRIASLPRLGERVKNVSQVRHHNVSQVSHETVSQVSHQRLVDTAGLVVGRPQSDAALTAGHPVGRQMMKDGTRPMGQMREDRTRTMGLKWTGTFGQGHHTHARCHNVYVFVFVCMFVRVMFHFFNASGGDLCTGARSGDITQEYWRRPQCSPPSLTPACRSPRHSRAGSTPTHWRLQLPRPELSTRSGESVVDPVRCFGTLCRSPRRARRRHAGDLGTLWRATRRNAEAPGDPW